jgi:prepilin-type N-terminal cleavage/methylation domain-containing protein
MNICLKSLRRQQGFTLVELMVVVAIIGLLSTVAIPNFKTYQAKAKVAEAKMQLSALYTAEASFFSDYNMYATCLAYMGFNPRAEKANRYYGVGFSAGISYINSTAYTSAINSGLKSTDCLLSNPPAEDSGVPNDNWYAAGKGVGGSIITVYIEAKQNPAGASLACDAITVESAAAGTCLGDQSDQKNMTYQASAVGYISARFLTPVTASGLTINHLKVLKMVNNGY